MTTLNVTGSDSGTTQEALPEGKCDIESLPNSLELRSESSKPMCASPAEMKAHTKVLPIKPSLHAKLKAANVDLKIDEQKERQMYRDKEGSVSDDSAAIPTQNSSESLDFNDESNSNNEIAQSMNPELYGAATAGDKDGFIQALDDTESCLMTQVSPQGNTVLHIAASLGHDRLIDLILHNCNELVKVKNSRGDLAFHLAASAGHLSTVRLLVCSLNGKEFKDLLKEQNRDKNTALHLALEKNQKEVTRFLIEEDPEVSLCLNKEGKSPLYMAAEAGCADLVELMMENEPLAIGSENANDRMNGKSLVHAAIRGRNKGALDMILSKNPSLIRAADEEGRSPLSYASSIGYLDGVRYLLDEFVQATYQRDQTGLFPIHMAASRGHIKIIQEFLRCCPDSRELLNKQGQNILHVAAKRGKDNVAKYVLKTWKLEKLINEKDEKGNTPIHLAAIHWQPKIVNSLTWDKRVHLELLNDGGLTALDAAEKYIGTAPPFRKRLTWMALKSAGVPRSNHPKANRQRSQLWKPPRMENYKDRVNTLLLVLTLVATVTFAAGFTMPGGYNNSSPNEGMATMVNENYFKVFVICDTIAMYSSIIAIVTLIWAQLGDLNLVLSALRLALPLLGISLAMMSLAFMAGVCLVVSKVSWLATVIQIMGIVFLSTTMSLFLPLYFPHTSRSRVLRFISYYLLSLVMFASGSCVDDDEDE